MIRYGLIPELLPTEILVSSRFQTGVPLILITLRHMLGDAETDEVQLFDEMQAFVVSQPPVCIQHHYIQLFAWLQQRFKRQIWVERSGGSLRFLPYFSRFFPDARFIHIVRDGRDTALSMHRHPVFRMAQLTSHMIENLGVDPFESEDRSNIEDLSDELRHLLPECFNASVFRNYTPPLSEYGRHWSVEIIKGLQILEAMPAQCVLTTRYEDILQEPEAVMNRLIAFIDPAFADTDWLKDVVQMVKPPRTSWQSLPPGKQEDLYETCLPGFAALKAFHISWE